MGFLGILLWTMNVNYLSLGKEVYETPSVIVKSERSFNIDAPFIGTADHDPEHKAR